MPTFRVIYDPRPGVRLLIEDIEANAIIETPLPLVSVRRRDVTAILRLCRTPAWLE